MNEIRCKLSGEVASLLAKGDPDTVRYVLARVIKPQAAAIAGVRVIESAASFEELQEAENA